MHEGRECGRTSVIDDGNDAPPEGTEELEALSQGRESEEVRNPELNIA